MSKKIPVNPASAPIPAGPYTPAIIAGDFVYVSGQVPKKPGSSEVIQGDIQAQTRQVLENVQSILAAAGCSMLDVVKVNAYLTDLADFAAYNEVYAQYFPQPYPARTTVQAGLSKGVNVEIDVVALLPKEAK